MGRSQRHKVRFENYAASGATHEQGAIAPAVTLDPDTYTVPVGPSGGPLQGSSLSGPTPAGIPIPTIGSLSPNTAVHGAADLTMTVTGTNFTAGSRIIFDGIELPTTLVDSTHVSATVKPSLYTGAKTVPVVVRNGGIQKSGSSNFTIT